MYLHFITKQRWFGCERKMLDKQKFLSLLLPTMILGVAEHDIVLTSDYFLLNLVSNTSHGLVADSSAYYKQ
jgi:hypothetical protein